LPGKSPLEKKDCIGVIFNLHHPGKVVELVNDPGSRLRPKKNHEEPKGS